MVNPREAQSLQPWADDGSELSWDIDVDDNEPLLDEFADDELVPDFDEVDRLDDFAPWRLIEIARENKYLQSVLADFEQYDDFEYSGEGLPSGYSH